MLEGSILKKLKDLHEPGQGGKRPLNFGVYYKNTLVALCHALEDSILTADYSPLVMAVFQKGKWYLQEADRYADLADHSDQILILTAAESGFDEQLTSDRPNVAIVNFDETDPISQEWHLIIVSPHYTAMVLCQELTAEEYGGSVPEVDLERKFYGFWTFEPELVLEAAELTIAHTGIYNADLSQQLREKAAAIATQTQQALTQQLTADHLGETVARVVEYLQTNQQEMQSHQALDKNLTSNELQAFLRVAQLIDQNDLSNPMAAAEVASLAEAMGQLVDLPSWQLHRLRLAGLLHRVALLQKSETVLNTNPTLAGYGTEVATVPLSCPLLPGVQVLRKMGRLKAIATILTHQSECWNGSGQPANLVGDQIPVESRILGLVACFQQRVMQHHADAPDQPINYAMTAALTQCQAEGGDRWDPKLLDVLELLVKGLQQGMSLPIALPKIAAGLWLLDSHSEEEILSYQDAI